MLKVLTRTDLVTDLIWCDARMNDQLGGLVGAPFDTMGLVLFIIDQTAKGRQSPWWPYLETLPQNFIAPYLSWDLVVLRANLS